MPAHTVKQGDCISSIAHATGFFWETLWSHPGNAKLKELRQNPNALLPGDVVFIPDKRRKEEPCAATHVHKFRIKGVPVRFKLRVLNSQGKPRSGIPYTLVIDGSTRRGKTDADGRISEIMAPNARQAKLTLAPSGKRIEEYEFKLGHINPVDDVAGLQARLQNLGYLKKVTGEMDAETAAGLWKFQQASKIKKTGKLDAATQSLLAGKYGG